ncbi:MAG: DMT family transporter [Rhizobiaceae bacterium]|nr:DMT family transporter [Rhizobiaceae bacterium]
MSLTVFFAVLLAAALHAAWNAAVKGSDDKLVGMLAIVIGHMLPAGIAMAFFAFPNWESMPYFLAGMAFHIGYQFFLLSAYKIGDFTQVYPIARGTGPLIVTLVSVGFLGVVFAGYQLAAVALIIAGLMSLSIVRQRDGLRNPKAVLMALATGCCIAGYSLVDGLGARISGDAVGFISAQLFMNGLVFVLIVLAYNPQAVKRAVTDQRQMGLIGGTGSYIAYAIVVWAFTQAPIALVTALRETSIIFALMIGAFIFKERLDLTKVLATFLTVCGAALLRFGKLFA